MTDPKKEGRQVYYLDEDGGALKVAQEANRQWGRDDIVTDRELLNPKSLGKREVVLSDGEKKSVEVLAEEWDGDTFHYAYAEDVRAKR
jgi:hypothetical protein